MGKGQLLLLPLPHPHLAEKSVSKRKVRVKPLSKIMVPTSKLPEAAGFSLWVCLVFLSNPTP